MSRRFDSIEEYRIAVDTAVKEILADANSAVIRTAKKAIAEAAEANVYSYQPQFYSRRMYDGGLIDPDNIDTIPSGDKGFAVKLIMNADWQQLYGGRKPTGTLADAIEQGGIPSGRDGMYGAPKRPFMSKADNALGKYGYAHGSQAYGRYLEGGFDSGTQGDVHRALEYEMKMRGLGDSVLTL